ncbi:hypothetical protein PHYBOEH_010435 [Phytophthora boehmeriae]|uniref:Uncharacterized protein n=1 Tax=Phytophthora boehmeriae TaxID=109152 RepID=A0A8T1X421_9STRA|nr:hypothetical protein PHYBOEH_010435 [Phytophthora boehmeriae]
MDEVCMFGRSVDVDGDEWIDLGLPSATCDGHDGTVFDEFETSMAGKSLTSSAVEPMPEPAAEQEDQQTEVKQQSKVSRQQPVKSNKAVEVTQSVKSTTAMKAAQSKEALMAFYLGRAKQMEVKSKEILVASAPPVVLRSLQEPFGR